MIKLKQGHAVNIIETGFITMPRLVILRIVKGFLRDVENTQKRVKYVHT